MDNKTSRRNFIKSSVVSTASILAAPAIVKASDKIRWKLVTSWPPRFPIFQDAAEMFAKKVSEATDGRLKIHVYAGGELVPPLSVFDTVREGAVEVGISSAAYWGGKIPVAPIFAGVPFGMNSQQTRAWLTDGGGLELWRKAYEPVGLIPFSIGYSGMQMAGWFKKPIQSVKDLDGLRMRMPGLAGKVLAKAGANIVLMPGAELYTALERGVIDATEWNGPYLDKRLGLHKAASYYYYPAWHDPVGHLELTVNKKAWDSLPEDMQAVIRLTADEVASWTLSVLDSKNSLALQSIKKNKRVNILRLPQDVLDFLHEKNLEVLKEEASRDQISKEVYASYSEYQKRMNAWFDIGEAAYTNCRVKYDI